jgi:glyoxylase-like metal-dependent hydrolase (beta-lactamase superfamily II)
LGGIVKRGVSVSVQYRVISIGALSRNRLWNEAQPKRPAHATTTLIRDDDAMILVDPGLPPEVLAQRLDEQAGLTPDKIATVFLTTFRPVHRRGIKLFARADWLMQEPEIEAMSRHLDALEEQSDAPTHELDAVIADEREILRRIRPADDKLTPRVHLFPTPGPSPGSAALLLADPTRTIIIAGDAVVTQDHFLAGQVHDQVASIEDAQKAFTEIVEIADEIVPGHDNAFRVVGR